MLTVCAALDALFEPSSGLPSAQFSILVYSRIHVFKTLKASGQVWYSRRSKDFVKKHGDDEG